MRRLIILLSLILIVFISGCGDQQIQTVDVNDGIIIKDFSFDQSEVYDGEYASLNLEVQNIGGVTGVLNKISVYGGWLNNPIDLTIDDPKDLKSGDPSQKIEGEYKYFRENQIDVTAAVQSKTDYQFGVRVIYNYETDYIGTVRFVNPTYLDSLSKEQRESLIVNNGIITSSFSNGPLNINPITGRSFVVQGSTNPVIKFGINNIGSGYPYDQTEGDYSVRITDETGVSDCFGSDETDLNRIKLSRGETSTFVCNFQDPSTLNFNNYVDRTFKIVFSYKYYTDGSTSITVNPNE